MAMRKDNTIEYVEGDIPDPLRGEYRDKDGKVIDITGFTITLHIGYEGIPLVKTATITDGVNGIFEFAWEPGDIMAGDYEAEVQIMNASGRPLTYPASAGEFYFKIREAIA
ncbi:MAG: phage baseplate upper protein [Proteobacteria bacterium]|nr:phage baseplate upper protein [Pseudomonadota bacterium]